ncbi:MAG: PTS sugar transporter subunit IIA [Clostridia bacterium]
MEEIIGKRNIRVMVEASDWEHAIHEAGMLLLQSGSIREKYIQKMIDSVKTLGPYIVIAPGIAIAHARPGEEVIKSDISIVTLKTPVNFGNKQNDPVSIVFAFAAEEDVKHLSNLAILAQLLSDGKKIDKIIKTDKEEELYKIINS